MKILNRFFKQKYIILETLEAGIVLSGAEVKSLRAGRADLGQSFAKIQNGEVILKNLFIPAFNNQKDVDLRADRKLLLRKTQIENLSSKMTKAGMTLVPLSIYFTRNFAKVALALAKSKAKFDKRRDAKEKDQVRDIERQLKAVN